MTATARKSWVNHEIVTLAVYLVGGELSYVDTEDVAKKANELAPGRFTWRKYPDQINIENVRAFLADATKEQHGRLLEGSGKRGWMLTSPGLAFARDAMKEMSPDLVARTRPTQEQKDLSRWKARESGRLKITNAYVKWSAGLVDEITKQDADDFFRIDDYVTGDSRERRLQRILNLAAESGDDELMKVASRLASMEKETVR